MFSDVLRKLGAKLELFVGEYFRIIIFRFLQGNAFAGPANWRESP